MIYEFSTYLKSLKGYSDLTVKEYCKDLKAFAIWVNIHRPGLRWSTITRDEIDAFIIYQTERGLAPATTNRQISAISALYKYMMRDGLIASDPTKYESRRKEEKRIPNTIPLDDIRAAYEHSSGVAHVLIGILASTGIRIQECLNLRYEDIDFKECSLLIHGKGAKQRIVYSCPEQLEIIRGCSEELGKKGKIFKIDQRQARYLIWSALKRFSKAPQLSPHAIRHTVATHLAKAGANVAMISTILGHSHLKTTQRYLDMSQQEPKVIIQQCNILNS